MILATFGLLGKAHDFESDGLYYNITSLSELTVSITYKGDSYHSKEYSGVVTIPSTVIYNNNTYSVTSIGYRAFYECSSLTSVTIPESVTTIGMWAFESCSGLTSVTIPEGVTTIVDCAFENCNNLTSIIIPESLTSVGYEAFSGTAWYNSQPDGVVYAGKVLYKYKGIMPKNTSLKVEEGTKGIAGGAFWGCSGLTSISLPEGITSIDDYAFTECDNLISITLPESVTSIGEGAFDDCCGLISITIPSNVTTIGYGAFKSTAWYDDQYGSDGVVYIGKVLYEYKGIMPENTSIEVMEGIKSITAYAFYECTNLISITLPESVMSIGEAAFSYCDNLTSITTCAVTPPSCGPWTFELVNTSIPIYVPTNAIADYQVANEWKDFTNFIGVESGIDNPQFALSNSRLIYDLHGRCIDSLAKGIYIVGGRKVIRK